MDEFEEYEQELAERIRLSFYEMLYPGDDRIVTSPNGWVAPHLYRLFSGKHWTEVSIDTIIEERESLPFFTPEGFRFFLPAFLIAALLYPIETDILTEGIFSGLTPPDKDEIDRMRFFLDRVSGFTDQQVDVLRDFVLLFIRTETFWDADLLERARDFWTKR